MHLSENAETIQFSVVAALFVTFLYVFMFFDYSCACVCMCMCVFCRNGPCAVYSDCGAVCVCAGAGLCR